MCSWIWCAVWWSLQIENCWRKTGIQRRWPLCLPSATPPPPPTPHLGPHRLLPARHTHNAWGWADAIGPWARKQSPGWWWCQGGLSDVDRLHRCCRIHGVARLQPLWDEESVQQQNLKLTRMDDGWFWWRDRVHMNNLLSSFFVFHHSTGQFPNSFLVLSEKVISTYRFVKIY